MAEVEKEREEINKENRMEGVNGGGQDVFR